MNIREYFDYQRKTMTDDQALKTLPDITCPTCGCICSPYWDNCTVTDPVLNKRYLVMDGEGEWLLTYLCGGDCEQEWNVDEVEIHPDTGEIISL